MLEVLKIVRIEARSLEAWDLRTCLGTALYLGVSDNGSDI